MSDVVVERWRCDSCGHVTVTEVGEQILAEFICLEGARRLRGGMIVGACMGTCRQVIENSEEKI